VLKGLFINNLVFTNSKAMHVKENHRTEGKRQKEVLQIDKIFDVPPIGKNAKATAQIQVEANAIFDQQSYQII
jgi:hypothetical protein